MIVHNNNSKGLSLPKPFLFFSSDIKELIHSYYPSGVKHSDRQGEDSSDCATRQYASKTAAWLETFNTFSVFYHFFFAMCRPKKFVLCIVNYSLFSTLTWMIIAIVSAFFYWLIHLLACYIVSQTLSFLFIYQSEFKFNRWRIITGLVLHDAQHSDL